ncbi:MAG: DUF3576 domain-containing protein [Alphaproteobacteria bacterium]
MLQLAHRSGTAAARHRVRDGLFAAVLASVFLGGCQNGLDMDAGSLSGLFGFDGRGVNDELWMASIDTLSFVRTVRDEDDGLIVSDWYAPPEAPDERFRVRVFVLGSDLTRSNLRVSVLRQWRNPQNAWIDAPPGEETAAALAGTIMDRAQQIAAQDTTYSLF